MQSRHGGKSQAEGGAKVSEPDENIPCHSQPTILSNLLEGNEPGSPVPGRAGWARRVGQLVWPDYRELNQDRYLPVSVLI